MGWLLVWSKCRFTDPTMRAEWIVRKQRVLHMLKDSGVEVKDYGG
jgi:hypothetical protein